MVNTIAYGGETLQPVTASINASNNSISAGIDILSRPLVGIIMPSSWTAAALTFQGSIDGTNFTNVYDTSGTETSYTVDASRFVRIPPADTAAFRHIKIRSGTAASPVNQAASRDLTLVVRVV